MNIFQGSPIVQMVKHDEGFKSQLYIDTEGYQTIGIGFCLDKRPMPEDVADYWCESILSKLHQQMSNTPDPIPTTYAGLGMARQCAVLNMAYQMGLTGLCKFQDMWASLEQADYDEAAKHALNSLWAKQTKKRAKRVAEVIRTGTLKPYGL